MFIDISDAFVAHAEPRFGRPCKTSITKTVNRCRFPTGKSGTGTQHAEVFFWGVWMASGVSGISCVRIGPENDITRTSTVLQDSRASRVLNVGHITSPVLGRLLDQGQKAQAPSIIDNHLPRGLL